MKNFLFQTALADREESAGAFEVTDFLVTSAGAADDGKPVVLDANGLFDGSLINEDPFVLIDGSNDLTADWTISTNNVTLTGGTMSALIGLFQQSVTVGVGVAGDSLLRLYSANLIKYQFYWDEDLSEGVIAEDVVDDTKSLINFTTSEIIINKSGRDRDFRIAGTSVSDLFVSDAVLNEIRINGHFETKSGKIVKTIRRTATLTLGITNHIVFCNTDGGGFAINLPAGVAGTEYRIINTGSSGNDITVSPNGAELLLGVNSDFTLTDGNYLLIVYETTEGWF